MRAVLISLLNRTPALKSLVRSVCSRLSFGEGVSKNYVRLDGAVASEEGQRLRNSWMDETLPQRQRALVDQQLNQYRSGGSIDVFDVFVDSVRSLPGLISGMSILEIGCSSGFYSEVINIAKLPLTYSGCDYSYPFIRLARKKYPEVEFQVEDATDLSYPSDSFDIVVSGCCLLHIPDYAEAVKEAARVATHYVIFHRTPVVWGQPEQWYRKHAYGVETVEIHFNEPEFLGLLKRCGLEVLNTYSLNAESLNADGSLGCGNRTYVCRKMGQ